ncbi:MAG: hypothetical protein ABR555_06070 [Pyrinomonadaceae bacterium]
MKPSVTVDCLSLIVNYGLRLAAAWWNFLSLGMGILARKARVQIVSISTWQSANGSY